MLDALQLILVVVVVVVVFKKKWVCQSRNHDVNHFTPLLVI